MSPSRSNILFSPAESLPVIARRPYLGDSQHPRDAVHRVVSDGCTARNTEPDDERDPAPSRVWSAWGGGAVPAAAMTEAVYLANAGILARRLSPYGYDIAMVGPQWYAADTTASGWQPFATVQLDAHGRPQPAAARFPSAMEGCGFAPLAAQVHRLGLRFGVHLPRGIPREAVARGLPIAGSAWRCGEVADPGSAGAWHSDMCGVKLDHPGAIDWYRAWFAQLAACGVDAVSVDDVASPDGQADDFRLLCRAIEATGRRIELSLSPSPKLLHEGGWPELRDGIVKLLECASQARLDAWPEAGVLDISGGGLNEGEGEGDARLTRDERMLMLTAWACARRDWVLGGDLRHMDDEALELVTNPELLALLRAPGSREWQAFAQGHRFIRSGAHSTWVAWLNTGDQPWNVPLPEWLPSGSRDCWARADLPASARVLTVPAHGARLVRFGAKA